MRKDQAKSRNDVDFSEKRWESVKAKCNPAIFELAALWKESIEASKRLGSDPSQEASVELQAKVDKRLEEIRQKFSRPIPPAPNTFAAQTIFSAPAIKGNSDAQGVVEWIHWERFRIPLNEDLEHMQRGDWDASRRVQRTFSDLEQLRCGKGPIRRFKGDLEHSNMFETLWGLGLDKLTAEELADFFEKYCPCGSELHDPESLKKQRTRFRKALQRTIARE